jgi:hypothetical protein
MHVLRFPDRDQHHGGALGPAYLDNTLRMSITDHEQKRCHQGDAQADCQIAQPAAGAFGPVHTPPRKADGNFILVVHDTLPVPD